METFYARDRTAWRKWLQEHHETKDQVWLIYYKKGSSMPTLSYTDAVDEALCFGWIDSRVKPIDDEKYMQFFSRRKPGSVWSKVNKEKIAKLTAEGRMTAAGLRSVDIAKQNGSWSILDSVEALEMPEDLDRAFRGKTKARRYFTSLSRTDRRNILQWLVLAKRAETRERRINEIVDSALQNSKPGPFKN